LLLVCILRQKKEQIRERRRLLRKKWKGLMVRRVDEGEGI
jgi:hypothetical protein